MQHHHDNPGVIAPPPLIYGTGLLTGSVVNLLLPLPFVTGDWRPVAGFVFIIVGLILGFWALRVMHRHHTSPLPERPTTAIVSEGPFRVSRNPIYLGFTCITLGCALWLNALWVLLALVVVLPVVQYGVILREEHYLERKFGAAYLEYKARVRRWF